MVARLDPHVAAALQEGLVLPAHPLALDDDGAFDLRHQRALTRYYLDSGAGGVAVGVHTTGFAVHDPAVGLYEPVLRCAAETARAWVDRPVVLVAGLVGPTEQAVAEAELARGLGYSLGLLSTTGVGHAASDDELLARARAVGEVLPVFGFYLQPAVGGPHLGSEFWRRLAQLESVVAIKIAPFDRYRTLDVVKGVAASGRADQIALYTGNDDSIVSDLVTPFRVQVDGRQVELSIVGGLLGQWAVGTRAAVQLLGQARDARVARSVPVELLARGCAVTDLNAAVFDAANGFAGCVAGINEVLFGQGLLASARCIGTEDVLSPGQSAAITAAVQSHPDLVDDTFVAAHLSRWLGP